MPSWLTNLAMFAVVLGIATAALRSGDRNSPNSIPGTTYKAESNVCVKRECYDTARRFKDSMDVTVNPCDDFHKYTCGNLVKKWANLDETTFTDQFTVTERYIKKQLKNLLEVDNRKDDIRHVKLTKALYKSCMNKKRIEAKGLLPLENLIRAIGGWPVLEGRFWNESQFDWMTTISEWKRAGLNGMTFMPLRIEIDVKNTSRNVIAVHEPWYELSWYSLNEGFDNAEVKAYYKYMVGVAVLLGAEEEQAKAELKEAMLFHIELNKIGVSFEEAEKRAKRYHIITLKELIERYPLVKWRDILARMYSPLHTIHNDEPFLVPSPEYIEKVIELMSKTKKRVQANYAVWQNIAPLFEAMNRDIREVRESYERVRNGKVKVYPRWEECVQKVSTQMGLSLGAMYMKKFVNPKTKLIMENMVEKIEEEFLVNLDEVPFMDEETKAFVKNKEKSFKKLIGYPKEFQDNDKLDDYYRDLELSNDDYFSNLLNLSMFNFQQEAGSLRKAPRENSWSLVDQNFVEVNVNHLPSLSTLLIPAGILQSNFFHPERPRYINFGSIGPIVSSTMHNTIYNFGSSFDENGNLNASWPPVVERLLDEQEKCLISQQENYFKNNFNLTINGSSNVNSDVRITGSIYSYYAYVKSMRGKAPEKKLPGLDFTPNQLYWIAAGNTLCYENPESTYRLIGSILNSVEFAKDFNCQPGSKMNPIKKCPIW